MSSSGLAITYLDKNYKLSHWTLSDVLARSLQPSDADPHQAKYIQKMVDKLKYCKEALNSIVDASDKLGASTGGTSTTVSNTGGETYAVAGDRKSVV